MADVKIHNPQPLLTAQTTGNGGILLLKGECEQVTVALTSSGTTSGGTITIEESPYFDPDADLTFAGTWSTIAATTVISASSFTGGASVVVHLTGSFWAIRARISSTITGGGTVSATGWAN